jgi:hypothetical protein
MKNADFIPRKDEEFKRWVVNFLKQLLTMLSKIGFPNSEYQLLVSLNSDFDAKLTLAREPVTRTPVAVILKDDARRILEKTIRHDIKEFLNYNRALTGSDREALGLTVYKTERTPAQVAVGHPSFNIDSSVIRYIVINFFDREGHGKPEGQIGAEIRWAIRDTPPGTIADLTHSTLAVRSPFTLTFDESERGKRIYIVLCWENTRGKKGPWSAISSAVIP